MINNQTTLTLPNWVWKHITKLLGNAKLEDVKASMEEAGLHAIDELDETYLTLLKKFGGNSNSDKLILESYAKT